MHFLQQVSPVDWNDIPVFIGVIVVYVVYRLLMTELVLKRVSQLVKPKYPLKFIHRTFDMIHYVSSGVLGCIALYRRPYRHCILWAAGCGEDFRQAPACLLTGLEKVYFMLFIAYYLVDIGFLWTNPDWVVFFCHHVITVMMISFCLILNVQVVGMCIMVLHDVVDVPMYIGKICIYLGYRNMQQASLVIMAILWAYLRMVNLPIIIFHGWNNAFIEKPFYPALYYFTASLLFVLMCCHVYWFSKIVWGAYMITKIGRAAITDNRSDE